MKRQFTLILVAVGVVLFTSGQITGIRSWAMSGDMVRESVNDPNGSPPTQPGAGFLTGPNSGDPLDIALNYLRQQTERLGLNAADIADLIVADRYVTQHNRVTHLFLRQRYHGIEIFNGVININIGPNGEVISLGNRLVGNLSRAVNTDRPVLTAVDAVRYAAQKLELKLTAPVNVIEDRNGAMREVRLSTGGISSNPIPARLIYQHQTEGTLRLSWSLVIDPPDAQQSWLLLVDAVDGRIWQQYDLILHDSWETSRVATVGEKQLTIDPAIHAVQPPSPLTPPTYRVFPLPLEHPNDGPGLPDSQMLLDNPADPIASPYGWLDIDGEPGHEFYDTRGNNVSAQEDRNGDDFDGFRPTGKDSEQFNFDYLFESALNPTEGGNTAAAIVNIFYWGNILHDITYRNGFDEASGNFQVNNYGHGGAGYDALRADVQDNFDLGARNNAFMQITMDGVSPQMGMYVFDYTIPNRDSALDNGIITHEYAHGISTRLVGGPGNPYCLFNAEQMGEGWSDWFTLALTTKADDTGSKSRGLGTYVLGQPPDGVGIRAYPYSTDMSIDPYTYADIKATGGDIYLIGQIWASMLWDMQWNLIEQNGFDPDFYTGSGGNNIALRLVMDGMKFVSCDPGFVDARNAILWADQINNGGVNQCTIWQAFAKRGLGASADQGSPYRFNDGSAAFDMPTVCLDELMLTKSAEPSIAEAGKVLTYSLVVANYLAEPLVNLTLSDPIPAGTTYVDGSASDGGMLVNSAATWQIANLNPDESVIRSFRVIVDRSLPTGALLTNVATVISENGQSDSFTTETEVVSLPEIDLSPTAIEVDLQGGTLLTRELTIRNIGPGLLQFEIIEMNLDSPTPATITNSAPAVSPTPTTTSGSRWTDQSPPARAGGLYAEQSNQLMPLNLEGLRGGASIDVLLLAAADVNNIQGILRNYPDIGLLDIYDARYATPMLEELQRYDTVIVISNYAFADPVAVGNRLADYIDEGGTVIQTTPTFYDPNGIGWGLRGRFIDEGYSPYWGFGDLFAFASLGDFDTTHPIMKDVTYAGDSNRQQVDLTAGANWVASWTDEDFIATKGKVVALNSYLADSGAWSGDIPLIIHNSIIWLESKGAIDAPWLSVSPITGTVADGQSQLLQVRLDARATAIEQAGNHSAILRVISNDPNHFSLDVPITMHVVGPELSVQKTPGYFKREVDVPVNFKSNGMEIAAAAFSIDFDERCLRFDPTDANNNGIPEAIELKTPPGFNLIVSAELDDVNGELDFFIGDLTPPIRSLPDGTLLTIELGDHCLPKESPLPLRVGFGKTPTGSFSSIKGDAIPGLFVDGELEVQTILSGDCNQDGMVNAADAISCVMEIFDGDGASWLDAPSGKFSGSPHGCDSNIDERIDAGDILCTVLIIFRGQGACDGSAEVTSSSAPTPSTLSIPDGITAQPGDTVTVPVVFNANGNAIAAAVFGINYDPTSLGFDPTDRDGDGIPDAITLDLPADVSASVVVEEQRIQIALADYSLPFVSLPDGSLVNITFTANTLVTGQAVESAISFASDMPASLGMHSGQSAALATDDGSVLISVPGQNQKPMEKIYLPLVER